MSDETPTPTKAHPADSPAADRAGGLDRRSFVVWAAATSLGATAFFVFATLVEALVPPARSIDGMTQAGRMTVARMSDLQIDTPTLVDYGDEQVFVIKLSATDVRVLDAACPHARCALGFDKASDRFTCPCHGSTFTVEGARISGPAPRGMIEANAEVVDGAVVVTGFES